MKLRSLKKRTEQQNRAIYITQYSNISINHQYDFSLELCIFFCVVQREHGLEARPFKCDTPHIYFDLRYQETPRNTKGRRVLASAKNYISRRPKKYVFWGGKGRKALFFRIVCSVEGTRHRSEAIQMRPVREHIRAQVHPESAFAHPRRQETPMRIVLANLRATLKLDSTCADNSRE